MAPTNGNESTCYFSVKSILHLQLASVLVWQEQKDYHEKGMSERAMCSLRKARVAKFRCCSNSIVYICDGCVDGNEKFASLIYIQGGHRIVTAGSRLMCLLLELRSVAVIIGKPTLVVLCGASKEYCSYCYRRLF